MEKITVFENNAGCGKTVGLNVFLYIMNEEEC
jgi:hypothetical protein